MIKNSEVLIALFIVAGQPKPYKDNPLTLGIDKRFFQSKIKATEKYDLEHLIKAWPQVTLLREAAGLDFNCIINLADSPVRDLNIGSFKEVLKPDIDPQNWFSAAMHHKKYTNIRLLSADKEPDHFKTCRQLSLRTIKGIYNNRDKALYYFSYLISGYFKRANYPFFHTKPYKYNVLCLFIYYLGLITEIFLRRGRSILYKFNWKIATITNNTVTFLDQPKNTFWADPFIVSEAGKKWVFFEELDRKSDLGHISVVALEEHNKIGIHQKVLQKSFHLSFPNVFKVGASYYMLPEQSSANRLVLYKSTNFPYTWEEHKVLIDNMKIIDPVWLLHDNKYWLFFNKIEEHEYENNERLYIYYADDLFSSNWKPHKMNPVIIDIPKARNAGQFFTKNGEIFRPSQNCGETYGSEITINKVVKLTVEEYEEIEVEKLRNEESYYGMHTVNEAGGVTVTDFLFKERNYKR
ncbi:hypothetical protein [Taibaiella sp. KBW10]|uniref:glucosamine inositolphosphorylceramide transferase family protein n=1 Tax=Taibaiella sp. KBW10 TaxID=2153357 RepID=UPI000F5AA5D7|nr:hypothetical protein [Taibaiella sp. KBW10]